MSGAPKEVLPDSLFVDLIQTEQGRGVAGESVSHTEPAAGGPQPEAPPTPAQPPWTNEHNFRKAHQQRRDSEESSFVFIGK